MRNANYILVAGIILGVCGFTVAALLDKRQLGMTIFFVGFFVGVASAVFIALTSPSSDFGKLGSAIKIAAGGFGVIVLGQLLGFLIGRDDLFGKILFFVGMAVMIIAIVIAALRMAKY